MISTFPNCAQVQSIETSSNHVLDSFKSTIISHYT
jgi:hypothetical protein